MRDIDMLLYFITPDNEKNKNQIIKNDDEKLKTALAKFKAAKEAVQRQT